MLKIKDSVDLKELGCDMCKEDFIWSYKELLFDRDTRIIDGQQFFWDDKCLRIDALYDLIKADLVEKVDSNER